MTIGAESPAIFSEGLETVAGTEHQVFHSEFLESSYESTAMHPVSVGSTQLTGLIHSQLRPLLDVNNSRF